MQIPKGSVFASSNPMALGKVINAAQWVWSKDGESTYSHAGIIIDNNGTTLECLWTVKSQTLCSAYKDDQVIIAKPSSYNEATINSVIKHLQHKHLGNLYPFWRLPMHLIPPLAKIAWFDRLVCSELVAKYEWLIGARHGLYKGTNPDTLVDEWRRWREFDVIFEGTL